MGILFAMGEFDVQAGRPTPPEPALSEAQIEADDRDVVDALRDLARMVSQVDHVEDVLRHIAGFAVVAVPGADGVGVTLVRLGDEVPAVLAWSATEPFVAELDRLQHEVCREGPCLTAMTTMRPLTSGSLGSDSRWPRFGGRAARLEVHSALALPLIVRDTVVGAINIYAKRRDVFTDHAFRLGSQFAGPAAVSVHNTRVLHQARDHAEQLQAALVSRAVIDQAIGILRARSGDSAGEAFHRLRQISQSEHVALADVAARLVDEAVRRAHGR